MIALLMELNAELEKEHALRRIPRFLIIAQIDPPRVAKIDFPYVYSMSGTKDGNAIIIQIMDAPCKKKINRAPVHIKKDPPVVLRGKHAQGKLDQLDQTLDAALASYVIKLAVTIAKELVKPSLTLSIPALNVLLIQNGTHHRVDARIPPENQLKDPG